MTDTTILKHLLFFHLMGFHAIVSAGLAGGRPNTFSQGNNAFAGVVNPANAVWLPDRFDFGTFLVNQKFNIYNPDANPRYPSKKINYTHNCRNIFTLDGAIQKHKFITIGSKVYDSSLTLAAYTIPTVIKFGTSHPIPASGITPLRLRKRTDIISAIFSLKLNASHSIGFSIDYLRFSLLRNGNQNADNPLRSVSPGHVTNNGYDHSNGIGFALGWRWNITDRLCFGMAWVKQSYCGQFRKYRGFEPKHARNYTPQTIGGGFSYRFTPKLSGRLEVLWINSGCLPAGNNNILSDGRLNLNKRGSNKSPGPGLNDATFINTGMGYKINSMVSLGIGFSHRIRIASRSPYIISHTYMLQTIYNTLSLGANIEYQKHDFFWVLSNGFKNKTSGLIPAMFGGGRLSGEKQTLSTSISWGYKY